MFGYLLVGFATVTVGGALIASIVIRKRQGYSGMDLFRKYPRGTGNSVKLCESERGMPDE